MDKIVRQVYISNFSKPKEEKISKAVVLGDAPKPPMTDDKKSVEKTPQSTKQTNRILLTDSSFPDAPKKSEENNEEKKLPKFIEKIKKIKNFEIYIAVIFVLIILLIYFSSNFSCSSPKKTSNEDAYQSAYDYCEQIESKLRNILSTIKNAGRVDVMITFESTPERIIAYITNSSSNISSGGNGIYNENTTNTSTPQIIYVDGDQIPLILKEISPKVTGVLVVAEGADDVKVKLDIINAVSVVLDVSADKIKVLTMNKG
jgi:stage III sporulation protein AG